MEHIQSKYNQLLDAVTSMRHYQEQSELRYKDHNK